MGFKQPRVPEYQEGESVGKYLKSLVLFLKDFCQETWTANKTQSKELDAQSEEIGNLKFLPLSGGTLTGDLMIKRTSSIESNYPARIDFTNVQTDNGVTSKTASIRVYDDHDAQTYGQTMVLQSSGNMVIGGGESPNSCYSNDLVNSTSENMYVTADNTIYFYSNANTYANKKVASFNTSGVFDAPTLSQGGTAILLKAYPVGCIYMAVNSTSPASLFGGTWEQLKDRFLLGAGSTYSNAATGGAATVKLTAAESGVGSHSHRIIGGPNGTTRLQSSYGQYPSNSTDIYGPWFGGGYSATDNVYAQSTSAGASSAHNNMPPYLVVYMWKRVS